MKGKELGVQNGGARDQQTKTRFSNWRLSSHRCHPQRRHSNRMHRTELHQGGAANCGLPAHGPAGRIRCLRHCADDLHHRARFWRSLYCAADLRDAPPSSQWIIGPSRRRHKTSQGPGRAEGRRACLFGYDGCVGPGYSHRRVWRGFIEDHLGRRRRRACDAAQIAGECRSHTGRVVFGGYDGGRRAGRRSGRERRHRPFWFADGWRMAGARSQLSGAFFETRRTGIYPIHGTIVIKDEILKQHPWVARSLFDAFSKAKAQWLAKLDSGDADSAADKKYRKLREIVGADPLPYGTKANLPSIEALADTAFKQMLTPRRMKTTDAFVELES